MELVAEASRLFIIFEGDGQGELLFEALGRSDRAFSLDLFPPAEQDPQLHALDLALRVLDVLEKLADPGDPFIDGREGGCVVVAAQGLMPKRSRTHHRHVRPVLVELHLVALTSGVPDDEGEEPQISLGVAGDEVESLKVEGGEVAMVILDSFSHERGARLGVERELGARRYGVAGSGLLPFEKRLEPSGLVPSGRPESSIWIRPRSTLIWSLSRPSSPTTILT